MAPKAKADHSGGHDPEKVIKQTMPTIEAVANVDTGGEVPSQAKNNVDQVLQPTGDGGVAGGKLPPVGAAGNEPPMDDKTITMVLQRNYVPRGAYEVVTAAPAPHDVIGPGGKVWKGSVLKVSAAEAREMRDNEIATRADDF